MKPSNFPSDNFPAGPQSGEVVGTGAATGSAAKTNGRRPSAMKGIK